MQRTMLAAVEATAERLMTLGPETSKIRRRKKYDRNNRSIL